MLVSMAAIIQWRRLWAGDPFKSEPGDCIRVSAPAKNFRMAKILRSNSFHGTQFFTKNLTTGEELQVIYRTKNVGLALLKVGLALLKSPMK
jgi:hypothetical protein